MKELKPIKIALAGNANVGKSVIFNELTGLHQHIGNWPGKTVEKAEGTLIFSGQTIDVIDLPGIYSLSTFSIEEQVTRQYIALEKPDVVVNVVDATVLERNLFFTLQLLELERPMIVALNQMDVAERKGLQIDIDELEKQLGVPVIPTIAVKGVGLTHILEKVLEVYEEYKQDGEETAETYVDRIKYGREIESRISNLGELMTGFDLEYPPRWLAIKLLEDDPEISSLVYGLKPEFEEIVSGLVKEIVAMHGERVSTVMAAERYGVAHRIVERSIKVISAPTLSLETRLDELSSRGFPGYLIMGGVVLSLFFSVFAFGDYASAILSDLFLDVRTLVEGAFGSSLYFVFIWNGFIEGIAAGITIALPYIIPFYIGLSILEDSGYLARIAFLMDFAMHKIGLHGKAFIPLMLGFGCNVPACLSCRIMETQRERMIAIFATTLVPCAATTVIILGLVGEYVGLTWALALYAINLAIILVLGRIAFKVLPGEPIGLIMEIPPYRMPTMKVTAQKTWFKLKDFVFRAFPLIVIGNMVIVGLDLLGFLPVIEQVMSPITVGWLGLPSITGITFIFGVLRKELTLIMLASLMGTSNFATVLTSRQMIVYAAVSMLYIPCIATIAALVRELGYRKAIFITVFEISFAILIGGLLNVSLASFMP